MPLLKKLLEIEPMNEEVLITLGAVYSQMSEHKLSIDCFKRALVFADKEAKREIRIDIALEYENMGAWQKAIRNLHEALEEDTLNETAVYELAFCYERTGQFKQAASFYEQFLEKQPYSFAAWYSKGNALQQCGRTSKPSMHMILPLPSKAHSVPRTIRKRRPWSLWSGTKTRCTPTKRP